MPEPPPPAIAGLSRRFPIWDNRTSLSYPKEIRQTKRSNVTGHGWALKSLSNGESNSWANASLPASAKAVVRKPFTDGTGAALNDFKGRSPRACPPCVAALTTTRQGPYIYR